MTFYGLDEQDNKILDILKNNARISYSDLGKLIGLSRVAVKNRMEALEQKGIIQGYKTIINPTKVPEGVQFIIDVEATPESYGHIMDTLGNDHFVRQVYTTTGACHIHAVGFAPNRSTLERHVNHLFLVMKGVKDLSWHMLLSTKKDIDGGVAYERTERTFNEGNQ